MFDLAAHQRERLRTLERDNRSLREHRDRLERILAITLKVAAGNHCKPTDLLRSFELVDANEQVQAMTVGEFLNELATESAEAHERRCRFPRWSAGPSSQAVTSPLEIPADRPPRLQLVSAGNQLREER